MLKQYHKVAPANHLFNENDVTIDQNIHSRLIQNSKTIEDGGRQFHCPSNLLAGCFSGILRHQTLTAVPRSLCDSLNFVASSKISYLYPNWNLKYLIYFRNSKWSMYQPFWWYSLYILYQSERDFFWLSVFFWGEKFWWFHGWLLVRYLWHFGLSIFQGRGTIFANFRPKKFRGAVKKWQNLNFKDNYLFQKLFEHVQWFFTENYQFRSSFFKYFIF